MLSVNNINTYLMGIFMYQCIHQEVPEIVLNLFQTDDDVHDYNTRQSQQLHAPYGRLDVPYEGSVLKFMELMCGTLHLIT